jgi:ATP-dependent RNA helicase DDX5/DBP2
MPNQIEDYIHRIGRTGRAGAKGKLHIYRLSLLQYYEY